MFNKVRNIILYSFLNKYYIKNEIPSNGDLGSNPTPRKKSPRGAIG